MATEERFCEACDKAVNVTKPHRGWYVAQVLVWMFILFAGPFLAFMPPLNLVTMPVFVFAAAAMVGTVSSKLNSDPSCPECGRDVPSALAKVAGRAARPANERLVERALVGKA